MTDKAEFIRKFKVGDKIQSLHFLSEEFYKILCFGGNEFFYETETGRNGSAYYSMMAGVSIYIEPKKTVKKWLWKGKGENYWALNNNFLTEEEAKWGFAEREYEKIEVLGLSPIYEVEE